MKNAKHDDWNSIVDGINRDKGRKCKAEELR